MLDGTFTEEKKDGWDERLATVFNRGFWDGYYQGQPARRVEQELRLGRDGAQGVRRPRREILLQSLGVAEFTCEAAEFSVGDKMLVTGPTTGVMYVTVDEIHDDTSSVKTARKGTRVAFKVPAKVRPSDKSCSR